MGFPILVRRHLHIESGPRWFICQWSTEVTLKDNIVVLSKVENPGSSNRPSLVNVWEVQMSGRSVLVVNVWEVHVNFRWFPLYDEVRNDNQAPRSLCIVYFQPVPKKTHDWYFKLFNEMLWNLTGSLAALLPSCQSYFTAIGVFRCTQTRSFKTSRDLRIIRLVHNSL